MSLACGRLSQNLCPVLIAMMGKLLCKLTPFIQSHDNFILCDALRSSQFELCGNFQILISPFVPPKKFKIIREIIFAII